MKNEEMPGAGTQQGRAKWLGVSLPRGKRRATGFASSRPWCKGQRPHCPKHGGPTVNVGEARIAALKMLHNHCLLRVAIVEVRIPLQFVEWVGR